ncbi:hypothetical protein ASD04_07080 [Devosia sp. Root436]|uniref:hypothetical protein n=1 Tax=Devosia sp. Root436 TaxID=1736537 RepID=UPI0006F9BA83|nr:hypothetical protein [Devosia sp. Root436]KQX40386.1 hypothetical protein ASD04_07080 [Devosia sp. Root436]
MIVEADHFPTTETVLSIPLAVAEYLVLEGLTAPQMRIALTLLCLAGAGGQVRIEKPSLERMTGVSMDAANRTLDPVRKTLLGLHGHPSSGSAVFADIVYEPGKRGVSFGVVSATLSREMRGVMAETGTRMMKLPADEMREYSSVPSIILRLRLGAALEADKTAAVARMRLRPEDLQPTFGGYARSAVVRTTSRVTGEVAEHVSLARAGAVLVDPAVNEITKISNSMRVKAGRRMAGRKWAAIVVEATRLQFLPRLTKPAPKLAGAKGSMTFRPGVAPDFRNS